MLFKYPYDKSFSIEVQIVIMQKEYGGMPLNLIRAFKWGMRVYAKG